MGGQTKRLDSCKMASVAERYLDDKCPFRFQKNFLRSSNQGSVFSSSGFANASKALKEWYPKVGEIQVKRNLFDFSSCVRFLFFVAPDGSTICTK